jgi:hypothetical protein
MEGKMTLDIVNFLIFVIWIAVILGILAVTAIIVARRFKKISGQYIRPHARRGL